MSRHIIRTFVVVKVIGSILRYHFIEVGFKSFLTVGSAFSFIVSDAEVCCMKM